MEVHVRHLYGLGNNLFILLHILDPARYDCVDEILLLLAQGLHVRPDLLGRIFVRGDAGQRDIAHPSV